LIVNQQMLLAIGIAAWLVLFVLALRGARWAYAIFVILAFVWIPARAGFHLHQPPCQMQFTRELVLGSIVKYKHISLWAAFFVMTWVQFRRSVYALPIAAAATIAVGILIEIEEGATATGYCKATDLLPDATGALIGAVIAMVWRRLDAKARTRRL
jgi:VanZ family protein